jgi:hypothetical protein
MNFDDYSQNYSGYGVTVTIIDTGVACDRENTVHYKYEDGKIIHCNTANYDNKHGTICAETILRVAPNAELCDICVEEKGAITESALICALNFADANLESDIICICLALDEYSVGLADVLKKIEKTFVFASGRKNRLSYPSDLTNVIKVYYDSEIDGVEIISENAIAVNCEEIQSSSLACAYISGVFSVILEAKALWRFDDVKNWIFPDTPKQVQEHNSLILPERFVAFFPVKYLEHKDNFIDNLIGYYDDDMIVRDFNGLRLSENYKTVHINTEEREKIISPTTVGNYFAGNFINNSPDRKIPLQNHYSIEGDYICDIEQPIIALTSFGYGSSKIDLQLIMHKNISKLGYTVKCSTYNPMGILFKDFIVFEYPEQIVCPKMIYSINKFIYELSIETVPDIFILNIGGSIRGINYQNRYNMGMLFETYLKAFKIDIVMLCVTVNVSIDTVLFEIERLKATGIAEVIVVVSDNQYDSATYESFTGMKYFKCSCDKQKAYAEMLRMKYDISSVHILNEFDSIAIAETIVKKFKLG